MDPRLTPDPCCHGNETLSIKGKGAVSRRRRRGAHLPHKGHWARRWINHEVCDAWPVRRQTYGYLPSRRASPPVGRYQIILLGDRGTIGVNNLPRVVARQCTDRESNSRPSDHKSDALAITLPSHQRLYNKSQGSPVVVPHRVHTCIFICSKSHRIIAWDITTE